MIKIITDSSAYFKKSEAAKENVRIVPMSYCVNSQNYYEAYSDKNGNFADLLKQKTKFTTSQPNISAFLSAFEEELANGNEILCITISSRLSGTYHTAYLAAEQAKSKKITVFDSQFTAGGLYLLINEANKLIKNGKTLEEIYKELAKIRERITIAFSVDDMTPLRNSGRIGFVRMSVGTILNIKPILLCKDGVVVADGIARGTNEIIKRLIEKIPANAEDIVINYIENNQMATNLYNVIKQKFPNAKLKLQKAGPVLGIHLGLYVIGISFI